MAWARRDDCACATSGALDRRRRLSGGGADVCGWGARRRECYRLRRLPERRVSVQLGVLVSRRLPRVLAAPSGWTRPRCIRRVRARFGRRLLRLGSRSSGPRFPPEASSSARGQRTASYGQYGGDFYWNGGSSQIASSETSRLARSDGLELLRVPARMRQARVFRARRPRSASPRRRSCSGCTRRSAHR